MPLRVVSAACLAAAAVAACVWLAAPASAHAILRSTTPTDGDALDAAPASVSLEFNEPVTTTAGGVRVFNEDGERVDAGDAATVEGRVETITVSVQPDLDDGTYVVSWRALSADDHPVHGAFVFTVGDAEADESLVARILADSSDTALEAVAAALRFVVYAAALVAAGGALFLVWVHDREWDERAALLRTVVVGATVAAVGIVAGVAVQAALVTGLGARAATDPGALGAVVSSSYGTSAALGLVGAVALAVTARRLWADWAVVAASTAAVVLLASFALTGHTASTDPRWLVVSADIAHTVAAAAWLGGLVLLLRVLRRRRTGADGVGGAEVVRRFSAMAVWTIVVVTVAGLALGWAEVRAPRALLSTAYGITLVAKVALVAVVLGLGAYNNRRLVPAVRSAGDAAWRRLRTTVTVEVAVLVAVVAVTAVLVNIVPARDAAGVTGPLSVRTQLGPEHTLDVTVDPNRVGRNELHLYLFGPDNRPAEAEDLRVELTMPAHDIGPIEREPTLLAPGHWTVTDADLPIAGRWIMTVRAAVTEFDEAAADIPLDVGG